MSYCYFFACCGADFYIVVGLGVTILFILNCVCVSLVYLFSFLMCRKKDNMSGIRY